MESTDQARLQLFPIGPVTTWGMALALKVLFCKQVKFLMRLLSSIASWHLRRVKKLGFLVFGLVAAVVGAGCLLRRSRLESLNLKAEHAFRRKYAQNMMQTAATYEEWASGASMLEKESGCRNDSHLYDEELVRAKLNELRHRRTECGIEEMMFCLRADLLRNLGNMCNPELHKGRLQTPPLIQEYIKEVKLHLQAICAADPEELTIEEKIASIHETRHAFGRTALLLSGGAALGSFHLGVVRTLIEHKLLPRVIAGASAGSILCSFVATRPWAELQIFFDDPAPQMNFFSSMGSIFAIAHRILTRGFVQEIGVLQRRLRQLIGDLTFQEAYDLSGRVLGISVCSPRRHEPPRLLNYLTSPHVVIWSAVTASCAFPGLFEAQELMAKDRQGLFVPYHALSQVGPEEPGLRQRKWRDGGLESDLPMRQLKELFNVNHFIVSQANPHTAPLLRLKELVREYGGAFAAKLVHLAEMEVKHRCNQVVEMGFGLHGIAKIFAQDWEGDVTIVLPATFAQFAKLIQNSTPSELRKYIMQGRRCTWAKLSAIEANCGIELMLDECVSELNKRRRAKKEAERNTSHSNNMFVRPAKRIPSWNCIAREGSLDEDSLESALQPGGPWGGPTLGKLEPVRNYGSDSDSGAENMDLSWTKAGGPLMRTASAAKYVLVLEAHGDNNKDAQQVVENGVETETRSMNNQKVGQPLTITVGLKSNGSSNTQKDDADGEDNKFSFFLQNGLRKSASLDMLFDREHCLWKQDNPRDAEAEYQAFSLNDFSGEDSPFPSPTNAPPELPGRLASGYETASLREGDHQVDFNGFMPRSFSLDGLMMKPKGRTKSLDRGFGSLIFTYVDADDENKGA